MAAKRRKKTPNEGNYVRKRKPKILFYDIETRPNLGYTWGKWEQNVLEFKEEWELLSVAYKWADSKKVHCITRQNQEDDWKVVARMHDLFAEADLLVAHNGDQFDQKKLKARMVFFNFYPPKILQSIDTKKVAKRYFNFNGNSLNDLARHLGLGEKYKHPGFEMWLGCMKNDAASWREMIHYNKKDVLLLEKVYERFLPWIQNHPNIAKLTAPASEGCPNCGSSKIRRDGVRANHRTLQQQWECRDCGSYFLTPLKKVSNAAK